jgi:hypothetical protein
MNTWPNNYRHAMYQSEHEAWNSNNFPGTRQECSECGNYTERCEEDSFYNKEGDPICEDCYHKNIS